MLQVIRKAVAAAVLMPVLSASLGAQAFEGPGTRAQGMGAFVAVADDASAVYWNPAGLASGAYFSLMLDRTGAEASPEGEGRAGSRSAWMLALSAPVVGLSYYRLRSTIVSSVDSQPPTGTRSRVESLVTHQTGATVVQSIRNNVAVGATVKLVRGIATAEVAAGAAETLLDEWDLMGVASNRVDADVGVMARGANVRAGLTLRNLTRPAFRTASGTELRLDRQARAGIAMLLTDRWTAAADLDLTRNRGPFGDVRTLAVGTEGRLTPRAIVRAGVQANTAGGGERAPVVNLGGTYAALGSLLVDAHFSTGSKHGFGGWGLAARVVF